MLPIHPGEILKEEYMQPLNLTVAELSIELRIPPLSHPRHHRRTQRHNG